jgi:hypothetical protein
MFHSPTPLSADFSTNECLTLYLFLTNQNSA